MITANAVQESGCTNLPRSERSPRRETSEGLTWETEFSPIRLQECSTASFSRLRPPRGDFGQAIVIISSADYAVADRIVGR